MTTFTTRDVQARCAALGFDPGPIDGIYGPSTRNAETAALRKRGGYHRADLFHRSGIHRIHWHWTAGANGIIELEREHYNAVVDGQGRVHDGKWRIETQADYRAGHYGASHTLNANTGAGSVAIDCMAAANESPFRWGSNHMTWHHINGMLDWTAMQCRAFDIPVSKWSTLSHSEIQPTLGIRQRWKWDINILPDMDAPGDAVEVGNRLREMLLTRM